MITPTLSVITTFYNEAKNLCTFIRRTRKVCKKLIRRKIIKKYELILVDDGSTDSSVSEIKSANKDNDIILVKLSRNFGVGECNYAGFNKARGDLVVYMDCDLQDPPELIEKMLDEWRSNPDTDVVYTTRTKRRGESWAKLAITKFGYRLLRRISSVHLPPDSGDFKLLSRRVVDLLNRMPEARPYTRGLISWLGFKQRQVFYEREERLDGRQNTKMPVLSGKVINYWLDSALISFTDLPLKAILLVGMLISFLSMSYLGVVAFQKIVGWYVPGWPALMAAILFLGGVQIFLVGVVGLYVGAIFRQTKNRPLYIVDKIFGKSPLPQRGDAPLI